MPAEAAGNGKVNDSLYRDMGDTENARESFAEAKAMHR
jgi:hypothetical protein